MSRIAAFKKQWGSSSKASGGPVPRARFNGGHGDRAVVGSIGDGRLVKSSLSGSPPPGMVAPPAEGESSSRRSDALPDATKQVAEVSSGDSVNVGGDTETEGAEEVSSGSPFSLVAVAPAVEKKRKIEAVLKMLDTKILRGPVVASLQ